MGGRLTSLFIIGALIFYYIKSTGLEHISILKLLIILVIFIAGFVADKKLGR
jgi:hypothetical protein